MPYSLQNLKRRAGAALATRTRDWSSEAPSQLNLSHQSESESESEFETSLRFTVSRQTRSQAVAGPGPTVTRVTSMVTAGMTRTHWHAGPGPGPPATEQGRKECCGPGQWLLVTISQSGSHFDAAGAGPAGRPRWRHRSASPAPLRWASPPALRWRSGGHGGRCSREESTVTPGDWLPGRQPARLQPDRLAGKSQMQPLGLQHD